MAFGAHLGALVIAVVVLVCYAYALKPMGFLIPTAIALGILSYQISPLEMNHGQIHEFALNHVMQRRDPMEAFRLEVIELD